jgi:2-polyprenyl-3-methyl-5-hydroxy-6-metoxy-1,4-benzoquinol methylase
VRGTDAFPQVLDEARTRAAAAGVQIDFEATPVEQLEPRRDAAELVVCCEVLEHLEDPERALDVLAGLARPWLIASVPREPLWRALNLARLSYVGSLGNTPGHLGHWSKAGFVRFLTSGFEVIEVRTPVPWTMALCRVESPPS